MRELLDRLRRDDADADGDCACRHAFESEALLVDAETCAGAGKLATSPDCRATVVDALTERDVDRIRTRANGIDRLYVDRAAALLVAAGRFADAVAFHDGQLSERARTDPIRACRNATARPPPVSDVAAETGLAAVAQSVEGYESALRPYAGPTVASARVAARPPGDARLVETRTLDTGSEARVYERPGGERVYHLLPAAATLERDEQATLAAAARLLAGGDIEGQDRAAGRAVRRVAGDSDPVSKLTDVLDKHTRGFGSVADLLADPLVSDVFATAPVADNPVRVLFDGGRLSTNVRLTERGAGALASRFRRASGRAFSRASPTLDASAAVGPDDRSIRVAGVTDPVSDGEGFVFRDQGDEPLTLPALVANDTLPADAAALLSVAVERACAGLIAGTRGAGKTTLLGALLWELPANTRTVTIEDTLELPVQRLQETGRDVQSLATAVDADDGPGIGPTEALRTALRLGEGALVLGEVRGEEARVLYEAMRVGANGSAVLGTVHGDGGRAVRERVVADLNVPASSFAATDLVVTAAVREGADGRTYRVDRIEEVLARDDGVAFAPLFEHRDGTLAPTGRIRRGESRLVDRVRRDDESYDDVRDMLAARESTLGRFAREDLIRPVDVATTYAGGDRDAATVEGGARR
jgi:type IV secretory pathway ATPase VirB11/archaellum biosynthesis ATPase